MEPQRYLRCLGQPILLAPNGEPIRFRTKKHLALLVFLAVDARSHRRERLAEFLWPRASMVEARHSLATALSSLRPRLGPDGLETSRDHVRLCPGRVGLDLQRLRSGDILGTEVTGPLEVAAFLDGFDIPDSTEFTHWKDAQQARLLPMIKDALVLLIDRCRRTGDSRQIEQLADRMLALDELSEEAIRAKMEARAFAGDRLTALEIFERWKQKLADELHAAPSDLVEGMAVRLRRRGWERTTSTNIPTVPTDQWRGRPFIGRTNEYRILYEAWEACRKGLPGHALVLGDSGVGKSTLVARLTTAAGLEGAAISRVQCYDLEREIPYSTVSGLILGLLDRSGVSATPPESLAEVARTVPEVRHRFPTIPASNESQGETARIRLTEAFHDMLTAIAEEHPVILVVDDLHLADDVSLAVLHLMMRRARGQPIMVVLIARPGELAQSPQAVSLLASAKTLCVRELELLPLTEEESLELFQSLIPRDQPAPSPPFQRVLLQAARGYPMVLELLTQDWQESGDQSVALSLDAMTSDAGSGKPAPVVYRDILNRITRSLDTTTRTVLNLSSLLGSRLNDPGLFGLADLTVGQTMSGMAELVNRRVLRDSARGLEFTNEMMRAATYVGIPLGVRRLLHDKIATHLVQDHERGTSDLGLEIAWHLIRAGRNKEAISHLFRGARESMSRGAIHEAERALSTALPYLNNQEKGTALLLLVELLQEQGRWAESLGLLENEQFDCSTARERNEVLRITARVHLYGSDLQQLHENLASLVAVIRESNDASLRVSAARTAATLTGILREPSWIKVLLDLERAVPTACLSEEELSTLALVRARLKFFLGDGRSSLEEIEAATALSKDAVSTIAAQFQIGLGTIVSKLGDYPRGLSCLQNGYGIARRLGNDDLQGKVAANMAFVVGRLGNYLDQLHWAEKSLSLRRPPSTDYEELLATYCAAFACAFINRPARALELIHFGHERFAEHLPKWVAQAWLLYSADLNSLLGRELEARFDATRATSGEHAILHDRSFAGPFSRWLVKLASSTKEQLNVLSRIEDIASRLETYDALDRAEVLAAMCYLWRLRGCASEELEARLANQLAMLPEPVTDQLGRLGMLK